MADQTPSDSSQAFEKALQDSQTTRYVLRLFIAGNTPKSSRAILNLRKLCEENLQGRYQLEVVDIHQQPEKARQDQVIAAPTLIKLLPLPLRRIIGDLSKADDVIIGLNLHEVQE